MLLSLQRSQTRFEDGELKFIADDGCGVINAIEISPGCVCVQLFACPHYYASLPTCSSGGLSESFGDVLLVDIMDFSEIVRIAADLRLPFTFFPLMLYIVWAEI